MRFVAEQCATAVQKCKQGEPCSALKMNQYDFKFNSDNYKEPLRGGKNRSNMVLHVILMKASPQCFGYLEDVVK